MEKQVVLILGATSSIARAIADALASQGYSLYLAARDRDELTRMASDLTIRYNAIIYTGYFDAEKLNTHPEFLQKVLEKAQALAGVIQVFGYMSSQLPGRSADADQRVITINFTAAVGLLNLCANYFAEQRKGFIVGVSSVAGDRGRQSNYIYGSAKGALSLYLQGLRNHLFKFGVKVITIKPGFVDTPMTFGKTNPLLTASPEYVGKKIAKAIIGNKEVIYLPWFWRYIMLIIKLIPENIFKRLSL